MLKSRAWVFIALLLGVIHPVFGQFGDTKAWIDFSQPYLRLAVAADGIYRVSKTGLKDLGVPVESISNDNYQIYEHGSEIPILVTADYIQFYGRKARGDLDQALYEVATDQLADDMSQYTDTAYYYLTYGSSKGLRYAASLNTDVGGLQKVETHNRRNAFVFKEFYSFGERSFASLQHPAMGAGDGWVSGLVNGAYAPLVSMDASDYVPGTTGYFGTDVVGNNNRMEAALNHDDYNNQILVEYNNGAWKELGRLLFAGITRHPLDYGISADMISSAGKLEFRVSHDRSYNGLKNQFKGISTISQITVGYEAYIKVLNGESERFDLAGYASDMHLEMTNFNGSNPVVMDIRNGVLYDFVQTGTSVAIRLRGSSTAQSIALCEESKIAYLSPVRLRMHDISYETGTNMLIISHKKMKSAVEAYVDYRRSAAGGSMTVSVAYVDEIFNKYYFGYHHPMAIKLMLQDLLSSNQEPQYVFFIGKGMNMSYKRGLDGLIDNSADLVPSIGSPCADWYYGRYLDPTKISPPISFGRLAARTQSEVLEYLNKVKAYEQLTINKWRKDVIHISGGKVAEEIDRFRQYMLNLGETIEAPKTGANIYFFDKKTGNEIDSELKDKILAKANEGAGLFSYFGHAGANTTEVDIGMPIDYNNASSPMIMYFGGCVLGGCFEDRRSLGEEFLMSPTGAVAWIASATYSFESMVYEYTRLFYEQMAGPQYGHSIGELTRSTIEAFIIEGDILRETQSWQTIFQGDPSLVLYSPDKPDYEITNSDLFITPEGVTAQSDSFYVNMIVKNLGMAMDTTLQIAYTTTYPNGTSEQDTITLPAVYNTDTLSFVFYNKGKQFGEYTIDVFLDPNEWMPELRENNNKATFNFFLVSNGSVGLFPAEYGIVSDTKIEFVAQSLDLQSISNTFQFELDTTPTFESQWRKRSGNVKAGLVGRWLSNLLDVDSQAYYWRVRLRLPDGSFSPWSERSFSYMNNSLEGWAQIDFKQFDGAKILGFYADSARRDFLFYRVTAPGQFIVQNHGRDFPIPENYTFGQKPKVTDNKIFRNNQYSYIDGSNSGNGMVAYVFAPVMNDDGTFDPWIRDFGVYQYKGEMRFDWMKTEVDINPVVLDSFISFVNQIPNGYHVLMYSGYYHRIADMPERFYKSIESLGSTQIRKLQNGSVWLLAGTKGAIPGTAHDEKFTNKQDSLLLSSITLNIIGNSGSMQSTVIGPSKKWRNLQLYTKRFRSKSDKVDNSYNIVGIDTLGKRTALVSNFTLPQLDLSFIDAIRYPYLQLELNTKNSKEFVPAKPKRWVVHYDFLPEGLINTELAYDFKHDTVPQGNDITLEIGYENVSKLSLVNVPYSFEITNKARERKYYVQDTLKALAPGESLVIKKSFSTTGLLNENRLVLRTNPNMAVPELYAFNNGFEKAFFVEGDFERPLLDVAIDGNKILNNDIVSPTPTILINGKDNNNFFLLDKPEYFEILLFRPDSAQAQEITAMTPGFSFTPATSDKRTAQIEFKPGTLPDGKYRLSVQLTDASGNTSGDIAYEVSFEVVGASTVSHFYPYPNPFSQQMHFVFTLTGSQVPSDIVIQILTVSGKVVREIGMHELGPIKIGHNVSEFAWDGTDTYGNRLANGVYLYRVKTVLDGAHIEHRTTAHDAAFTEQFGKIYLLR
ncbi:MAG: hypothetical protein HYZ16_11330 [Bacteroidetes bacterium]|nr:hypothetical protein [Bacteroidota bacterium]